MSGKYILIGFLATLAAMVAIVIAGIVAVAFKLKNPDAFAVLAAAVTGLVAVAIQFRPGRDRGEE